MVVASHNGFDVGRKLASRGEGIDVLLTGHTHDALPAVVRQGETLLVATGSHGKFLGRLVHDLVIRHVERRGEIDLPESTAVRVRSA